MVLDISGLGNSSSLSIDTSSIVEILHKCSSGSTGLSNIYNWFWSVSDVLPHCNARSFIVMPFLSREIDIVNKIPLITEIIQGDIPSNYFSNVS